MAQDFRIAVGFFRHHKTRKLERRLGLEGVVALLRLWEYAAEFRTRGDLYGMTVEDIELAVGWDSEASLVSTLVEVSFLVEEVGGFALHDWQVHNPWVAEAEDRSAIARLSRLHRENPEMAVQLKTEGRKGLTAEEYRSFKRSTTVERPLTNRTTPAPAPVLAPEPAPEPVPTQERQSSAKASKKCPAKPSLAFEEFWGLYPSRNGVKPKKAKAWEAFWKITCSGGGVTPDLFIEKIRVLGPSYGDYPRDAVTWLNQRGWEDEIGPVRLKPLALGHGSRPNKAQVLQDQNIAVMNEWLASKSVQG
jgi:hypothetical protein